MPNSISGVAIARGDQAVESVKKLNFSDAESDRTSKTFLVVL
ncbi:MAG TPA: hypothetical protein VGD14_02020 [bacterium]